MSSYVGDRHPASWKEQTLDSIAAPPLPLTAFFILFIMMMYFTNYSDYKETVEKSKMGMRFFLFLLPLLVMAGAYLLMFRHRLWWDVSRPLHGGPVAPRMAEDWSLPWGVVVVLVVVLLLIHYR